MNQISFPSNPSIGVSWETPKKPEGKAEEEPIRICRDIFTPASNEPPVLSRKDLIPYMGTGGIGLDKPKNEQPLQAPLFPVDMRRLMGTGGF